jgi:hypothetical protein
MIKINLLPLDKRKTERTPLKGAGLMIADAAIFVGVAILVVISLIQISNTNAEIAQHEKTLKDLAPAVKEHDQLLATSKKREGELKDLELVTGTRPFEWSQVIDLIWDSVSKHKRVWLDSFEMTDGKTMESKISSIDPNTPLKGQIKHGIVLKCHVSGLDVRAMTAFRKELRENAELARFFPIMNFDVQYGKNEEREALEKYSLEFEISLVNTGQTKDNTPEPVKARAER